MRNKIQNNTRVRVTRLNLKICDWTDQAKAARADKEGQEGTVIDSHDAHGLYYDVRFEDGEVAYFDPSELEELA